MKLAARQHSFAAGVASLGQSIRVDMRTESDNPRRTRERAELRHDRRDIQLRRGKIENY
jgi:hypothetical protein